MIGKTLGHYRVIQELGRGGMGEVYLADDLNLNRKVVCIMRRQKDLTRREILMGVASTIAGNLFAHQQQAERDESPTFSVNVDVVNVFVTVRDKKGSLIKDLSREDFTIREDGRIQNIQYFAQESDLPLTIGLIVDTTPSEANMLDEERNASRLFFDKILRPGKDSAFLIQYSKWDD